MGKSTDAPPMQCIVRMIGGMAVKFLYPNTERRIFVLVEDKKATRFPDIGKAVANALKHGLSSSKFEIVGVNK